MSRARLPLNILQFTMLELQQKIWTNVRESRKHAVERFRSNELSIVRKGTWKAFQSAIIEYMT